MRVIPHYRHPLFRFTPVEARDFVEFFRCFRRGITMGFDVNRDGLPSKLPFWNITDWCPWWPRGVVAGADEGATSIITAQYINALDEVAEAGPARCKRGGAA